jgi:fluoroacetyl-CoA thioesterase
MWAAGRVLIVSVVSLCTGLSAVVDLTVSDADTAIALRSGEVPVLGTPRILALVEEATVRALEGHLDQGSSTVGMRVQLEHISPTPIGGVVRAEANLERIEGRRLLFHVSARDERGLIAAGKVTRVVVDVERFMEKTR